MRTLESRLSHPSPFFLLISNGSPVISWNNSGRVNYSMNAQLPSNLASAFSTRKYHLFAGVQQRRWLVGIWSSTTTSSHEPLMQRRHMARLTLPTQAGLISYRHPGRFSSIMAKVWMTLVFPFSLILLNTYTTSSFMSAMRAQSFSSSPAPHMMELAQAGNTLSQNLALLMKRWLANSAQCEGRVFNWRRNQLLRRTEALDRFRSSNSLCANWGICAPRLEKYVSDRMRERVYRPIFWHSISQLSNMTCPIGVQQVCLQWGRSGQFNNTSVDQA